MATVLEASEEGGEDTPEGSEETPDMSDKAQRRAQSRRASTSGRRPGEEFLRLGPGRQGHGVTAAAPSPSHVFMHVHACPHLAC